MCRKRFQFPCLWAVSLAFSLSYKRNRSSGHTFCAAHHLGHQPPFGTLASPPGLLPAGCGHLAPYFSSVELYGDLLSPALGGQSSLHSWDWDWDFMPVCLELQILRQLKLKALDLMQCFFKFTVQTKSLLKSRFLPNKSGSESSSGEATRTRAVLHLDCTSQPAREASLLGMQFSVV